MLAEGRRLRDAGHHQAAVEFHERAVALDPGLYLALCELAVFLEERGHWSEALRLFRRGAELARGRPEASRVGSDLLQFIGNYQLHLFGLQRSHAHDPARVHREHRVFGAQIEAIMAPLRRA
jgi:tetratricopeptide (TPR) repeat protein